MVNLASIPLPSSLLFIAEIPKNYISHDPFPHGLVKEEGHSHGTWEGKHKLFILLKPWQLDVWENRDFQRPSLEFQWLSGKL